MDTDRRSISFWHDSLPEGDLEHASPTAARRHATSTSPSSVAGFTGLWTAYYLAQRDPALRDRRAREGLRRVRCLRPQRRMGLRTPAHELGAGRQGVVPRRGALALQRAANDAVDEVGRVAAARGHRRPLRQGRLPAARDLAAAVGPAAAASSRTPAAGTRPRTTSGCSTGPRRPHADQRRRRLRRPVHPALRGDPPCPHGARAGRGRRTASA